MLAGTLSLALFACRGDDSDSNNDKNIVTIDDFIVAFNGIGKGDGKLVEHFPRKGKKGTSLTGTTIREENTIVFRTRLYDVMLSESAHKEVIANNRTDLCRFKDSTKNYLESEGITEFEIVYRVIYNDKTRDTDLYEFCGF